MFSLKGYHFIEKVYESRNTIIYRGIRKIDDFPIIVKILKKDYPTIDELNLFEYEYRIAKQLDLSGVIRVYDMESIGHSKAIIMEDFDACTLDFYMHSTSFDLKSSIKIVMDITDTINSIHQHNFIYKNVTPHNILINPTTKEVKLIDFGIAAKVIKETQSVENHKKTEGNLAYISPEQTGRINRSVDFRSDFYSIGIIFYEMLIGRLPFEFNDDIELIHCHIARHPTPPYKIRPDIPLVISNIVMKLISKAPEERYQSALSLKSDLEECYRQLKSNEKIVNFEIGIKDIPKNFQISEKLYGRETEIKILFDEFEKVVKGNVGMILFKGPPGIGKTFLINKINKALIQQKGYFTSGKFDQYNGNIPYSAIIQAFSDLIKQMLTETKDSLEEWKNKLLHALGMNGQVIINVIPELELIIGKQPSVAQLNPVDSQNRFNLTFKKFIRVFTQLSHPLVIFVDDLQWADPATISLLKVLLTDPNNKYLLFIGSYRDNEVDDTHPLTATLSALNKIESTKIKYVALKPLELNHINQLIDDTLHYSIEESKLLSKLIKQKTQGNTFFVVQLLYTLYLDEILEFNSKTLEWKCNLEAAKEMKSSDNVVGLMVKRLKNLSPKTQKLLQLASCLGNKFDLNSLSLICNDQHKKPLEHLQEAINEGLITPLNNNYEFLSDFEKFDFTFKFLHDKVQQASYSLIPEDQRKAFHLEIGRSLVHSIKKEKLEDKIFDIVNQYNRSLEIITDDVEKVMVSELNLMAGRKAKKFLAYKSALNFLLLGTRLLEENKWFTHYNLMFNLNKEKAEVEYLNGNFEQAKACIEESLVKAQTKFDKSQLYMLMIVMYTMSAKYDKAIEVGIEAIDILGIALPIDNLSMELDKELNITKKLLENRPIKSLIHNQEMKNPEKIVLMKLMTKLAPAAYLTNFELWSFIAAKRVNLSIKYGNIAESSHSYTNFGILASQNGKYQFGYEFGLLGLKVSEKWKDTSQKCRAYFNLACFLVPWVKHMSFSDSLYEKGAEIGLQSGELQFVGYMYMSQLLSSFRKGKRLEHVLKDMKKFLSFTIKTRNQSAIDTILGFEMITKNLTESTFKNYSSYNEEINQQQYIKNCNKNKSFMALCYYFISKSQVTYLFGRPDKAIDYVYQSEKLLSFVLGSTVLVEHNYYYSLSLTALYKESAPETQKKYQEQIQTNQRQMKIWSDNCSENFLHKYLLIEAEIARISQQYDKAIDLYDQAIESAKDNNFIQNEALANELAAKFFLSRGRKKIAVVYLKEAYYLYNLWGAMSKVKELEESYSDLFLLSSQETQFDIGDTTSLIDMKAVIKASQAISGEMELDKLIERLLQISLENSGAERGFFIMESEGNLVIKGEVNNENVKSINDTPLEQCINISNGIVSYVARTREYIILDDAFNEGLFTTDPYIARNKSKSILCMPIICRGKLMGIGYLENNLSTGAFTPNFYEVLKILFSQAAISIENAIMYNQIKELNHDLEITVDERTKELNTIVKKLRNEIKERKETEQELKKSEKRYRLLIELLPDGVLVHNNFEILFANEVCAKIMGIGNSEGLLKKNVKEIVHPDYHKIIDERLYQILTNGKTVPLYELEIVRSDGTIVYIESISTLVPYKGESAVLSVIRDITDRKQAEKLRRSVETKEQLLQEAFEYDRVKTEFIANISHELRTPLNVMLGAIQMFNLLLNCKSIDNNSKKIIKYSHVMKQNCYRLIRLVNNLIDITKVDAGYFQLNIKQCNISNIVKDITLSVAEYVKDSGIKLIFDTNVEEKIMPCDPDKMERILLNLLSNSIKFTEKGGTMVVNLRDKEDRIVISVKDTGIGISEDKQSIIFDRFAQADRSLSRSNEGSGIGLSLVKSFVELHGGAISLKSKLGYGSEFIIELPVQELECPIEEIAICDNNQERIQIEFSDIYF